MTIKIKNHFIIFLVTGFMLMPAFIVLAWSPGDCQTFPSCPPPPAPPPPTLYVNLYANPSSGTAPLNNVDLTADVVGTATGQTTYKFDCTNDGIWEKVYPKYSSYVSALKLCDYPSAGTYTAAVKVERGGLEAFDTAVIIVGSAPTLSVSLSANPSTGTAPLNDVDLTAAVGGTASGQITYKFDCTNDGIWDKTHSTTSNPYTAVNLCDYPSAGTYTAKVRAERNGLTAENTTQILVSIPSQPIIISPTLSVSLAANPSAGLTPLRDVDLTATVAGTATGKIKYKFDCTSNGSWEKIISTDPNPYTAVNLCDYSGAANYTAKVAVEREGQTAEASVQIVVSPPINHPPIADAGPDRTIEEGKSMKIYGSGSDPDGDKITYAWHCSGGVFSNGESPTPTYYAPKNPTAYDYYCNLTVTDEKGFTAFDRMLVVITKPNTPAQKTSVSVVKTGKNLTKMDGQFNGTISAAPGDILQFKIAVTNTGSAVAKNIIIKDIFPQGINYWGNLMANGVATSAEIWSGANIGDIPVGHTKIMTFDAKVSSAEVFGYGVNALVNSVTVFGNNIDGIGGSATINVMRTEVAGATDVNTGAKPAHLILIVSLLLFISMILFNVLNNYLMLRSKTWSGIIERIKIFKSFVFSE